MARRFFGEQRQYKDRMGFRWRSTEVTRLEGFSDAVFAFSVTLLIVSLEVPRTFAELFRTMQGFVAFAASFAILIWIWHVHYLFFRRYGLQDAFTKTLNAVLLFVVLFYVYPLKFVFTNVIHFWSGGENTTTLTDGSVVPIVSEGESSTMMIIYAIGFIAVFACYVLLYWNARRKREELRLNPLELYITSMQVRAYMLCVMVGLVSLSLIWIGGDEWAAWSGISYSLLGPVLGVHGFFSGSKMKRIESQMQQQFQQRQPQRQGDQQRFQQHSQQRRPQGGPRHQGGQHPRPQQGQRPRDQRNPDQRRHQGPQPGEAQEPRRPE